MHELALKLQDNPNLLLGAVIVSTLIPAAAAVYFVITDGAITVMTIFFALLAIAILVFGLRAYLGQR